MKKMKFVGFWIMLISAFGFASCEDDGNGGGSETTRVEIRLTDAPAPYDAVNINIQSVYMHVNSDWEELDVLKPGVYNLLDFQNGIDTLLIAENVEVGKVSQIRLVLGDDGNSVVIGGQTYPLETPSAQQSGLKLNLQDELVPGIAYKLCIDFDAARSIVTTGSGKYILKPVMRAYTDATGGSLTGYVLPQEAGAMVWAILESDTVASAHPNPDGYFLMAGLPASASWKVSFDADDATGYKDSAQTGVSVAIGKKTDLGTTTLTK